MTITATPLSIPDLRSYVPWRHGLAIPSRFQVFISDDLAAYDFELTCVVDGYQPACEKVEIRHRPGGAPLNSRGLRQIRLLEYLGVAAASVAVATDGGPALVYRADVEARRRGRSRLDDDFLRVVAETYKEALRAHKGTRRALQAGLGPVSPSTLARWVREARRRGFLGGEAGRED